jgi:hypothetical protein
VLASINVDALMERFTSWLQVVLILPVGGSVNSNISIDRFRHFHEEFLFT